MYRNAPYGGWKQPIPADCDLQHVDWKAFEGEAPPHEFDPNRYINWRFFWDYDGSNVFENMVHQVGFWYKLLGLKIPRGVTMNGGNYLSPDMEMPDTMDVSMDQPENMLFTWNSGSGIATTMPKTIFCWATKARFPRAVQGRVHAGGPPSARVGREG